MELTKACLLNSANCHLKLKQWRKAETACTSVITDYGGGTVKAFYRRGLAREALGSLGDSCADLERAHDLDSEVGEWREGRGGESIQPQPCKSASCLLVHTRPALQDKVVREALDRVRKLVQDAPEDVKEVHGGDKTAAAPTPAKEQPSVKAADKASESRPAAKPAPVAAPAAAAPSSPAPSASEDPMVQARRLMESMSDQERQVGLKPLRPTLALCSPHPSSSFFSCRSTWN